MPIPTEPIGSIPRPADLIAEMHSYSIGKISREQLLAAEDAALRNTLARFEHTGSPIITDGEQSKL
jgi:5-methyltetrahydropteroyltriglutamate--homocysteine methyltransferase